MFDAQGGKVRLSQLKVFNNDKKINVLGIRGHIAPLPLQNRWRYCVNSAHDHSTPPTRRGRGQTSGGEGTTRQSHGTNELLHFGRPHRTPTPRPRLRDTMAPGTTNPRTHDPARTRPPYASRLVLEILRREPPAGSPFTRTSAVFRSRIAETLVQARGKIPGVVCHAQNDAWNPRSIFLTRLLGCSA